MRANSFNACLGGVDFLPLKQPRCLINIKFWYCQVRGWGSPEEANNKGQKGPLSHNLLGCWSNRWVDGPEAMCDDMWWRASFNRCHPYMPFRRLGVQEGRGSKIPSSWVSPSNLPLSTEVEGDSTSAACEMHGAHLWSVCNPSADSWRPMLRGPAGTKNAHNKLQPLPNPLVTHLRTDVTKVTWEGGRASYIGLETRRRWASAGSEAAAWQILMEGADNGSELHWLTATLACMLSAITQTTAQFTIRCKPRLTKARDAYEWISRSKEQRLKEMSKRMPPRMRGSEGYALKAQACGKSVVVTRAAWKATVMDLGYALQITSYNL